MDLITDWNPVLTRLAVPLLLRRFLCQKTQFLTNIDGEELAAFPRPASRLQLSNSHPQALSFSTVGSVNIRWHVAR
jgi:hypothetical protein